MSTHKLWKEVFENGTLKKRTDYLGGLIITDSQIEFIPHEEGRFLPKSDGTYKTEFHYKDHLGNLRLAFRKETATRLATMEVANSEKEEEKFENIAETRITSLDGSLSHTGSSASLLNGGNANKTMGASTAFSVEFGDSINLEVFANYSNSGSFGVSDGFALPTISQSTSFGMEGVNFLGNGIGLIFSPMHLLNNNSNVPTAYLAIHFLDEDGEALESHTMFVKQGANSYKELSLQLEVTKKEAKYAVVYLANESPTNVYFDDLKIEHTRLIWQENAYYPGGKGILPLDYEPEGSHRWKYNGKELEEATGYVEFEARNHDVDLLRFTGVDPRAEEFHLQSDYAYAANNPSTYMELRGEGAWDDIKKSFATLGSRVFSKDAVKQVAKGVKEGVGRMADAVKIEGNEPKIEVGTGAERSFGVALTGSGEGEVVETDKSSNVHEVKQEGLKDAESALNMGSNGSKNSKFASKYWGDSQSGFSDVLGSATDALTYESPKVDTVENKQTINSFNRDGSMKVSEKTTSYRVKTSKNVSGDIKKDTTHHKKQGSSWRVYDRK